jgi:hypothetical protein
MNDGIDWQLSPLTTVPGLKVPDVRNSSQILAGVTILPIEGQDDPSDPHTVEIHLLKSITRDSFQPAF